MGECLVANDLLRDIGRPCSTLPGAKGCLAASLAACHFCTTLPRAQSGNEAAHAPGSSGDSRNRCCREDGRSETAAIGALAAGHVHILAGLAVGSSRSLAWYWRHCAATHRCRASRSRLAELKT